MSPFWLDTDSTWFILMKSVRRCLISFAASRFRPSINSNCQPTSSSLCQLIQVHRPQSMNGWKWLGFIQWLRGGNFFFSPNCPRVVVVELIVDWWQLIEFNQRIVLRFDCSILSTATWATRLELIFPGGSTPILIESSPPTCPLTPHLSPPPPLWPTPSSSQRSPRLFFLAQESVIIGVRRHKHRKI